MGTIELTRARLHAARLDEEIAGGEDPATSPELAARARLLLRSRERRGLAAGLRRAVADARLVRPQMTAAVHVAREEVRACAPELLALAAELGDRGARAQGVALTRRLLCDGSGPLYRRAGGGELREAVAAARSAL